MNDITENDLSPAQKEIYDAIIKWTDDKSSKLLTFGGVAGSGKTTITTLLAKKLTKSIAFCAYTGKAANVLRNKLDKQKIQYSYCGTIHGLIYIPIVDTKTLRVRGWKRRPVVEEELIFVDEASMVGDRIFRDLQSYGKKILAIGDHGQLSPIEGNYNLVERPRLVLNEIHRQAADNPIIKLSAMIRHDENIFNFKSEDNRVQLLNKYDDRLDAFILNMYKDKEKRLDAAILCYFNASRVRCNQITREALGFPEEPSPDDVVICLKNNQVDLTKSIFNGMRGFIETCSNNKEHTFNMNIDFAYDNIKINDDICKYQFNFEKTFQSPFDVKPFGCHVKSWAKLGLLFDFGYCITGHKCVDPNTLVETENGLSYIKNITDSGQISTPNGTANYSKLIKNKPSKMLLFETADGFRLGVTPEHGIDVWDNEHGYIRKQASEVQIGDLFRLKLGTDFADQLLVELPMATKGDVREKTYKLPQYLTEEVAEFLGIMVADGTIYNKKGFRVAKRHQNYVNHFEKLCIDIFGAKPSRFFKLGAYHCEVNSSFITRFLLKIGGMEPNNKFIPNCILKSNCKIQAAFLRGLFEDGSIHIKNGKIDHIELSSSFKCIIDSVKIILLRLGIVSGIVKQGNIERVEIYGAQAKKFGELIGFISQPKIDKLSNDIGQEMRYFIPVLQSEIDEILGANRYIDLIPKWQLNLIKKRHRLSKYRIMEIINNKELVQTKSIKAIKDRLKFHHSKVRFISEYIGESMCVEVPEGHQFVQNGICGWNSQGSSFSNVVVFVERSKYQTDDDFRRHLYTCVTRSSENLVLVV